MRVADLPGFAPEVPHGIANICFRETRMLLMTEHCDIAKERRLANCAHLAPNFGLSDGRRGQSPTPLSGIIQV